MQNKPKLIRITTVPISLCVLLEGQHLFMSQNGFEVIGVSSSGDFLQKTKENEAIRTISVEMTRSISPLKDLKSLWLLYKLFRKEKPIIVHTHTPKAGTLGMVASKLARIPFRLHTVAGLPLLEVKGNKRRLLNLVEKITYACATNIYPNSYGLKDHILENKFTSLNKINVIGKGSSNGVDTTIFNPKLISRDVRSKIRNDLGIKEDDFVFLFVGRVVEDKGVNELVAAFQNTIDDKNHTGNSHLLIVGIRENNLSSLLSKTDKTIAGNPRIHALGYKTNVVDYFGISDVLTFPSYREGFPNVVMQAAAMELNCIVSDINGCNEIIENGVNGWVVPVKNSFELQVKMQWCIDNKKESKQMGLKGREIIKRNFERSYVQNELLNEYNRLLKR